jgi:hypothetical protein
MSASRNTNGPRLHRSRLPIANSVRIRTKLLSMPELTQAEAVVLLTTRSLASPPETGSHSAALIP